MNFINKTPILVNPNVLKNDDPDIYCPYLEECKKDMYAKNRIDMEWKDLSISCSKCLNKGKFKKSLYSEDGLIKGIDPDGYYHFHRIK